ncbi:MAG: hypothetical protein KDE63_01075 [Novosphingobium sp.]|nr:hypothetical protein [Novosphingobium sp.]
MFNDSDIKFHTPDKVSFDWAETGYFNFYIPEENILGFVYIVHRAGVGATVSDLEIIRDVSHSPLGSIYVDLCNHNPLPESAEKFELPTGLIFEARSIRDYSIRYNKNGIELDLKFEGLMEPYDIHDPTMDPMAELDPKKALENSGFGEAYSAHFDMAVRVTGSARIGERSFAVNCLSTMDHSWGPRREDEFSPIVWANAHFSDGYCVHAIFAFDPDADTGKEHDFKHGYVLIDGDVRGVTGSKIIADRDGITIRSLEWRLTDVDGREHILTGQMLNHHPWLPYANNFSPISMIRWQNSQRDDGYGTYMEGWPLNHIRGDSWGH